MTRKSALCDMCRKDSVVSSASLKCENSWRDPGREERAAVLITVSSGEGM